MNILFVTGIFANNEFEDTLGGMPKAVYNHAIGMKTRGHDVRILCGNGSNRKWEYKGIEVWNIMANSDYSADLGDVFLNTLKREIRFEKTIIEMNKEKKIDIIQYTGWFGVGLFHYCDIPAVMRISSYTKDQLEGCFTRRKSLMLSWFEQKAAKRMDFVFAPSRIMANSVQRDIKKKVEVFETPFVPEITAYDETIYERCLKNKRYFLFFGRMSADKGIFVIRDILYELFEEYNDLFFVFVGGDVRKVREEMKAAAREFEGRVIFTGQLNHSQLFPIIRNSEAVVMPSIKDNLPNGCAEAMFLQCVVIGTHGSSLEQYIVDGKTGLLCNPNDSTSLMNTIKRFMQLSVEQRDFLAINAHNKISSMNGENYFDNLEKKYEEVIEMQRGKGK